MRWTRWLLSLKSKLRDYPEREHVFENDATAWFGVSSGNRRTLGGSGEAVWGTGSLRWLLVYVVEDDAVRIQQAKGSGEEGRYEGNR